MIFNPSDHLIQIKNRNGSADYLPVQFRLIWFREQCPQGSIETEMLHLDLDRETEDEQYQWNNETRRSEKVVKRANGIAVFRATVKDGKGGVATGTKSEKAASFSDFIEKAETGSIGRALASLGFGTQFAPELDEEHRIVDAPVETSHNNGNGNTQTVSEGLDAAPPSAQQLESLKKLAVHLGEKIQRPKTYAEAKAEIERLSAAYNEMTARGRAS
jgi:hypothetical protein